MSVIGFTIEILVAALLLATVVTTLRLHRRLDAVRAEEETMRRTAESLVAATDRAERAVATLRGAVADADRTLAERLGSAERFCADLDVGLAQGHELLDRIGRIVASARQPATPAAPALATTAPLLVTAPAPALAPAPAPSPAPAVPAIEPAPALAASGEPDVASAAGLAAVETALAAPVETPEPRALATVPATTTPERSVRLPMQRSRLALTLAAAEAFASRARRRVATEAA